MTRTHRATFVALLTVLAVLSYAAVAVASPLSDKLQQAQIAKAKIDALDRQLQAAAGRYNAARARMSRADAAVASNSRKLDALLGQVDGLQSRLDVRAAYMYRTGPLGFLEVLVGSSTFQEFSANWDLLTALGADDAATIGRLKAVRAQALSEGESMLRRQSDAAKELRVLEVSRAAIQTQLAQREALLSSTRSDIKSLESDQARRAAASVAAVVARAPGNPYTGVTGSGGWSTAVASWYGPGFYGRHMADGEVLRPDSMIVAHKTLRFGTLIEFMFRGHRAVAKVADRGPYVAGREFDLGPGTARVLHFDGVARVRYRIIGR